MIVVFEGDNMTPLGLLQELHLRFTLPCIPIFTSDKAKQGQKTCVSCCPICASIIKNDSAFLNHILISHYWSNFVCGKCLDVFVTSGQQMKKDFLKCHGITDACEKPDLQDNKSLKSKGSGESGSKSKKDKGDKCSDKEKDDKSRKLESKTGGKVASQEQVQESQHHSSHLAGSSTAGGSQGDMGKAPHSHWSHKKSKKCGKKLHKKSRL